MSLKFKTAPSSRISKSTPRASSSPLKRAPASSHASPRKTGLAPPRLPDTGRPVSLLRKPAMTVAAAMDLALDFMFDPIPTSGLSSTRITSTYTARVALPRVVSVCQIQALMGNATKTERELATLTRNGNIRRIVVPLRGMTGGGEEVLIRWTDLEALVEKVDGLEKDSKKKLLEYVKANPTSQTIPRSLFDGEAGMHLVRAGFFTLTSDFTPIMNAAGSLNLAVDDASLKSLTAASIAAPAGSMAAAGGSAPVYNLGGSGGGVSAFRWKGSKTDVFHLTLPGMGSYLKLLIEARYHLVSLLGKSHGAEAPQSLLQDRWDGGVSTAGRAGMKLPAVAKTRKWKWFYGLRSQWVMAECVGAGMLELFETGSVGNGVRATGKRA